MRKVSEVLFTLSNLKFQWENDKVKSKGFALFLMKFFWIFPFRVPFIISPFSLSFFFPFIRSEGSLFPRPMSNDKLCFHSTALRRAKASGTRHTSSETAWCSLRWKSKEKVSSTASNTNFNPGRWVLVVIELSSGVWKRKSRPFGNARAKGFNQKVRRRKGSSTSNGDGHLPWPTRCHLNLIKFKNVLTLVIEFYP